MNTGTQRSLASLTSITSKRTFSFLEKRLVSTDSTTSILLLRKISTWLPSKRHLLSTEKRLANIQTSVRRHWPLCIMEDTEWWKTIKARLSCLMVKLGLPFTTWRVRSVLWVHERIATWSASLIAAENLIMKRLKACSNPQQHEVAMERKGKTSKKVGMYSLSSVVRHKRKSLVNRWLFPNSSIC